MKRSILSKFLATLLALVLLAGLFPTTVFSAEAALTPDGSGGWFVNMPATGEDTLDLTDKSNGFSFKVYDDGGSASSYQNYDNGTLTVTAHEGFILSVSGSGTTESGYDYLIIYDGITSEWIGKEYYTGSFSFGEMNVTGNVLQIYFYSDGGINNSGFELTVTLIDPTLCVNATFTNGTASATKLVTKNEAFVLPAYEAVLGALPERTTFLHWLQGGTEYAPGDSFTASANVTFTAVLEAEPVVCSDGQGGFYSIMPKTSTLTADLSDRGDGFVLKVYDDGGPNANYSNNCDGSLLITAPAGYVLSVSGSGYTESTSYDYLYVYDGDTTEQLGGKYGGRPFTMEELTSTGNALKIRFISDNSQIYSGFELTVTLVDLSAYARVSYEYDGTVKSSLVAKGTEIQLSAFETLFTLPERAVFTCWRSGGTDYNAGDVITATEDVTFTAVTEEEPAILSDGEGGYYAKIPKSGTVTADLSDKQKGFSLKVYDHKGPDAPYGYNCEGFLLVEAPEGYILSVSGSVSTYKNYDYLYLFDGDTATMIGPKYEGTVTMNAEYTTGNILKLYFYSYYGNNYPGVDLTVTVVDPAELVTISFNAGEGSGQMDALQALPGDTITLPACGFTLPEKTYFDYYTDGTNLYHAGDAYEVTGNATLTAVYIEKILVTYTYGGESHVKEYRKGASYALETYENAGFAKLPYRKAFKQWRNGSDGKAYGVTYQFTADADVTFTAEFNDLPILIEDDDGGYYALVPEAEEAELSLSDKPNGFTLTVYDISKFSYYPNNCDGALTLIAPEGYVLSVSGITQTESYYDDYVIFYDTDPTAALGEGINNSGKYGGYIDVPELTTTGNRLKIRFVSDFSSRYTGFKLTVTAYDPATRINVSFESGRGDGTMNAIAALSGVAFVLPECAFTTPSDELFLYYTDGVNNYPAGAEVTFNADTTLTALYAEALWLTYTDGGENDWNLSVASGSEITLPTFDTYFTLPSKSRFNGWKERESGDVYQPGDVYVVTEGTTFDAIIEVIPILVSDGAGGWYVNMPASDANTVDLSDKQAGFSFKVYDDGGVFRDYSASSVSTLLVKAPAGHSIKVSGSVNTESNWDYLRFYEGSGTGGSVIGSDKYTGTTTIDSLISNGNLMFIYFNSDSSIVKTGYELTVTVVKTVDIVYVSGEDSDSSKAVQGDTVTVKDFYDLFDEPYGYEFICWTDGENNYDEGDEILVTCNLTLTAVFEKMPTVTFDGNGAQLNDGSGETVLPPLPVYKDVNLRVPHANMITYMPDGSAFGFETPAGKVFGGWQVGETVYGVGEMFSTSVDVTAVAIWTDPSAWDILADTLDAEEDTDLGTITLTEDLIGGTGSRILYLPEGVTATIDLAGFSVDGSTVALATGGMMIEIEGNLTVVDSVGGGRIFGGGMQVLTSASLVWNAQNDQFKAGVALDYSLIDERDDSRYDGRYATIYYPTLYEAMQAAAALDPDYKDEIPNANDNNFYFGYNDAYVIMYADATIASGETWEVVSSGRSIWFDLHGHTFDIQGALVGGMPYIYFSNGVQMQGIEPTDFHVVSTVPGVFRSSGNVEVRFQFATAGDEIFITGGEFTNFAFIAGNVHITGGRLYQGSIENYLEEEDLAIEISGEPQFENVDIDVWGGEDESDFTMTVNGSPRFAGCDLTWNIDRFFEKTYIVLNGGYFDADPRADLVGMNDHYMVIGGVEDYSGQADWAYDPETYVWRISGAGAASCDLTGDNELNINDVTALLNALADGTSDALYDLDRNGAIDITDVTSLLNILSGFGGALPEDDLTISRAAFKEITGYALPALPGSVIVGSSDLRTGQHTVACFDITGDAELLATINAYLQAQIGRAPDNISDDGGAAWEVEIEFDGEIVTGQLWTMFDTESSPNYTLIYVNFSAGVVTASYAAGRQNFYEVTGVLLPLLTAVEADDSYPYTPGDTSYCFDLIGGTNLSHDTFDSLFSFLLTELSGWSYTQENQGSNTDVQFTHSGAWIQLFWDNANRAVYVNAIMNMIA